MKLGFISDLHVGNPRAHGGELSVGQNARCRQTLAVIGAAAARAQAEEVDVLVVCGDVFDTPKPLPQQLAAFRSTLLGAFKGDVFLLVGNHDRVSDKPGDHALGPLDGGQITVIEKPLLTQLDGTRSDLLLLPFRAEPTLAWLPQALEVATPDCIVAAHFGIYERHQLGAQPWLAGGGAVAIEDLWPLLTKARAHSLYVGDFHTGRTWEHFGLPHVIQVGALVPTGWDNPGLSHYGGLVVHDVLSGTSAHVELPGPRFIVVTSQAELASLLVPENLQHQLYVDWRTTPERFAADQAHAASLVEEGWAMAVDVHVDRKFAEERARAAAGAARSRETLEEAASAYVAELALPDGIARGRVLGHVRRLLGV